MKELRHRLCIQESDNDVCRPPRSTVRIVSKSGRAVCRWSIQSLMRSGARRSNSATTQGKFDPSARNLRPLPGGLAWRIRRLLRMSCCTPSESKDFNHVATGNLDSSSGRLASAERRGPSLNAGTQPLPLAE